MAKTLGHYLLNEHMPTEFQFKGAVTKKELLKQLAAAGKKYPHLYGDIVQGVKKAGDTAATFAGVTVGLDDIEPDYKNRDPYINSALTKLKTTTDPEKRRKIILDTQEKVLKGTAKHPSDMSLMVKSGGRGNAAQFMKTVASPVAVTQKNGDASPWMIRHSYSEGLRPDECWVANSEARRNAIATKESVSEPGAFGKVLTVNMSGQVVTMHDCNTSNGTLMSIDDTHIIDRHLAQSVNGFAQNSAVTAGILNTLRKENPSTKTLKVRGPLTCEAKEGLCQLCYGKDEWGKLPKIGTNMGVRSAQALSEPLTQFALNAKHGVRMAHAETSVPTGLKGLQTFLEFPKSFTQKAALANTSGTISSVQKAPQGGHTIHIDTGKKSQEHYVPPQLKPTVKKNEWVNAGDVLSSGVAMPNEVVRHKDLGAGRQYIAETVHQIYAQSGSELDKRHSELLAKSHLNYVRVLKDPDGEFLQGDVVPFNNVQHRFKERTKDATLAAAKNKILGDNVLQFSAGTRLTEPIIETLKKDGIENVPVHTGQFRTKAILKPLTRSPLLDPDWLAKMGHRYLRKTMMDSAAEGAVSSLHGVQPIPAFVAGTEFGEGPGGRY